MRLADATSAAPSNDHSDALASSPPQDVRLAWDIAPALMSSLTGSAPTPRGGEPRLRFELTTGGGAVRAVLLASLGGSETVIRDERVRPDAVRTITDAEAGMRHVTIPGIGIWSVDLADGRIRYARLSWVESIAGDSLVRPAWDRV